MDIGQNDKLIKALKGLKKPELTAVNKAKIKENIFEAIETGKVSENLGLYPSLRKLKNLISDISRSTIPNAVFKARLSETIYSFAKSTRSNFALALNWQRAIASFLIFGLVLSAFTIYVADIPVTKAAHATKIVELTGNVEVLRGDKLIKANVNMPLEQGDIVVTGDNATAVIRYIDDSVSRLSPQSELSLLKLYWDEEKSAKTEVEIELARGRVWNQVVNLVGGESTFKVGTGEVTAEVTEKASFDVAKDKLKTTKVNVYNNKIAVSLPGKTDQKTQVVLEGYGLESGKYAPQINKIDLNSEEDQEWINENQIKDEEYKKEVEEEKKIKNVEEAGITSENPLYTAKKLNESTKLLLTTDDTEKAKLKIDIAIKRLNEAAVFLQNNNKEKADPLLEEFNQMISEVISGAGNSEEIMQYFSDVFAEEAKDFSGILPDSPQYAVKEAIWDAKKKTVNSDEEMQGLVAEETEELSTITDVAVVIPVADETSEVTDSPSIVPLENL